MDSRTFSLLGFDRIKGIVASKTQTTFGIELAQKMHPNDNITTVEHEFNLIQECLNLSEEISLMNVLDLRPYLTAISTGTVLTGPILNDAKITLDAIRKIKEFLIKRKESSPKLYHLIECIQTQEPLEKAIDRAIDEFGEVKSEATPKLKKLRTEITKKRNVIIKRLESIIIEQETYLQDDNITIRHNRYCIPLKVEAQKKISGILHEFSPAGKTIFIEPLSLVENQNELARIKDEEKNEVQRILSLLSKALFAIRDELSSIFLIIGEIDFLFAKKRFAIQYNCTRPAFSKDGIIRIIKGVHPLLALSKKEIVPLDLIFPKEINVILISGPNAGGKTVVLKTVGLFTLMCLSGMYLPAANGTEIPFFQNVFADIGDEQSLDSNLSSFTAHLLRLKEILINANKTSLILLDEIGSSTAPEEGSALAIAILENLRDKGAYCLTTSHLNPLKAFVNDTQGMVNAAMEYTTHPTYRFTIGLTGTSSALEISKGLGFPETLLDRAKKFLDQDWLKLSERLKLLASETDKNLELNQKLIREKQELERLRSDYESRLNKFKSFEHEERQKILIETRRLLSEQRRNIENLVRNIKESNAEKNAIIKAKKYIEEQLQNIDTTDFRQKSSETTFNIVKDVFEVDDYVFSKTFQKNGLIIEKMHKSVTVAFGSIKFELAYDDLEKIRTRKDEQKLESMIPNNQNSEQDYKQSEFEPILNIIGQTKEEAIISLQRFLDDAINNQISEVSIIHGKGKGILKDMLWNTLRSDKRVEQLRYGEPFEGGMGMTKVIFKK